MPVLPGSSLSEEELRAMAARRAALLGSVALPPQRAATELQLSRTLGVQPAVVSAQPELAAQHARVQSTEKELESATERLRRVYGDAYVAALAHDDVPALKKVERFVGGIAQYVIGGGLTSDLAAGATDLSASRGMQAFARDVVPGLAPQPWTPPEQRSKDRWELDPSPGAIPGALRLVPGTQTRYDTPEDPSLISGAVQSTGRFLRTAAPLVATGALTGLATGGPPGMVVGAGLGVSAASAAAALDAGFSTYDKARDRLGPGFKATAAALVDGIFEYLGEKYGEGTATAALKKASETGVLSAFKPFMRHLWTENIGEQVTTLGQDAGELAFGVDPNATLKSYLEARPYAALQTAVGVLVQSGLIASPGVAMAQVRAGQEGVAAAVIRKEVARLYKDHERLVEAEGTSEALTNAFKAAGESQLRSREPTTFAEVTDVLADGTSVYLDGALLAQLPPEFALSIPGVREQASALADGGLVALRVGDLVNAVAGTPYEQIVAEHVRRAPDSLNMVEAQQQAALPKEEVLAQAKAIIAKADSADQAQAAHDWVRERIYSQLRGAKVYTRTTSGLYADWMAAFFTTYATRVGAPNARALYEGGWTDSAGQAAPPLALTIEGPGTRREGDIVRQDPSLRLGELSLTGYHFSRAARTTLTPGAFGTGLMGSGRDTYLNAADKRLAKRIYFYANKGTGIRPEAGVGGIAHQAQLRNVYDADQDPLRLKTGDPLAFESAVLDAGFDGYATRLEGTQSAQVVMLGDRNVQVTQIGPEVWQNAGRDLLAPAPRPSTGRDQVVDRLRGNRALPVQSTRDGWVRALRIAGMNAEAAAVEAALPAEGTKLLYKDELVKAFIDATPAPNYGQRVSLRTPTPKAGRADPHLSTDLGLEYNLLADPAASGYVEKAVALFNTYSGFKTDKRQPVVKQLEEIVEQMVENLTALYYTFPEGTRERSKMWYAGGRKLIEHLERRYGNTYTRPQLTAVMAVMSPGMDWFINVTLGERIVDIYTNQQATVWTPEMEAVAQQWASRRKNKDDTDEKAAVRKEHVDRLRGTMLAQATTDYDAAIWTILYDRAHNPNTYRVVTPDGGWAGFETNNDGTNSAASFANGIRPVAQAIRVLRDPSIPTISRALGESHKVRNFYNNLLDPDDPNSVTIDTHAVGAALVLPLSQSSKEVKDLFGGLSNAVLGLTGTYVIFAEAYRRAAERAGVLPREMQSVTWETVRALFPAAEKEGIAGAAQAAWARYKAGELTLQEARDAVFEITLKGRQLPGPSWVGSASGLDEGAPGSSYTGELRGPRVEPAVGAAERGDRPGAGEPDAARTLGQRAERAEQATTEDFTAERIRDALSKDGWAILTAADPGAQKASDEENAAAMAALQAELAARGLTSIPVIGRYGDVQPSLIVVGLQEGEAEELGSMFGQESILDRRGLVYMSDGSITPTTGEVQLFDSAPADYYTEIPGSGVYFSVGLDFSTPETGATLAQYGVAPSAFDEAGYRPAVVAWAKAKFGDAVYGGSPVWQNFVTWFGDSKVVDAEGKPLVVYHGMPGEMEGGSFRPSSWGSLGPGVYFTSDPAAASSFATGDRQREGKGETKGSVVPVFLRVERALDDAFLRDNPGWQEWLAAKIRRGAPKGSFSEENDLRSLVGKEGVPHARAVLAKLDAGTATMADIGPYRGPGGQVNDAPWMSYLTEEIRKSGWFDGVILKNSGKGFDEYVVFTPEQIKSAIGNRGSFSRDEESILAQDMLGGYTPSRMLITLSKSADRSTFIHEGAHFFFHALEIFASREGSPQEVKDQFAKAMRWFNLTPEQWSSMTFAQKEPYHERFARSWEQYQLEGKAPSLELRALYRRFTSFMKAVYGSLKQFLATRFTNTGGEGDELAQYAGEKAVTADLSKLTTAREMEAAGASAENIRLATGWFRGKFDKMWRYEFSDARMSFKTKFEDLPTSKLFGDKQPMPLGEVLDHPTLFEAYPDLKDVTFIKRPGLFDFGGLQGWQNPETNEIGLTPYAKDPIGTLAHEIQHWIQTREGFARGGNENSVLDTATPEQLARAGRGVANTLDKKVTSAAEKVQGMRKVHKAFAWLDLTAAAQALTAEESLFKQLVAHVDARGGNSFRIAESVAGDAEGTALYDGYKQALVKSRDAVQSVNEAVFGPDVKTFELPSGERDVLFSLPRIIKDVAQKGLVAVDERLAKAEKDFVDLQQRKAEIVSGSLEALKRELKTLGLSHELYRALAGEIEARDTAARRTMSRLERAAFEPYSSENIPLDDVIVTFAQRGSALPPFYSALERQSGTVAMRAAPPGFDITPAMREKAGGGLPLFQRGAREGGVTGEQLGLNDDIRRLFDWMMATDEQIAQAEAANGMVANEDATAEALEKLGRRSASAVRWTVRARNSAVRAAQLEAEETRGEIETRVRADFTESKEYRPYAAKEAIEAARDRLTEETKDAFAKAKADWRRRYDAFASAELDRIKGLWVEKPEAKDLPPTKRTGYLHANRGGINAELEQRMLQWEMDNPAPSRLELSEGELAGLADLFGYPSAQEMLSDVANAQPLDKVIEALVDSEMLEEHADLASRESIEQAANDAVHNEARARMVAAELAAQEEALAAKEATGETDRRGRPLTVRSILVAAKTYADQVVALSRLRDFKANAWKHTGAERRAVRAWSTASKAGDTAAAIQAKKEQVLQNAAAKAFAEAREEARAAVVFFRKVLKGNDERLVRLGRDPSYVNLARAILRAYGFENKATERAEHYVKLVAEYDSTDGAIVAAMNEAAQARAKPMLDLTLSEMRELHETIKALWDLSSSVRSITVDGVRMATEDAAQMLIAEHDGAQGTAVSGTVPEAERQAWGLLQTAAAFARMEQTALRLDKGKYGPHWRILFLKIKKAADAYRERVIALRRKWLEITAPVEEDLTRRGSIVAPELNGFVFGRTTERSPVGRVLDWTAEIEGNDSGLGAVIHALLHRGNPSNTRKLIEGFGWGEVREDGTVDTSRFDAFIARLADEGVLQKRHMDFVQSVWDMMESMKSDAQKAHKAVYGRLFAEQTAEPLQTPWGLYAGGYVPVVYEPLQNEERDAENSTDSPERFASLMPQPHKGFTIGRTNAKGPLRLDVRLLLQHVDEVAMFSSMAEPVREVERLLNHKGLKASMRAVSPTARVILRHFLARAGRQQVQSPLVDAGPTTRLVNLLAKRTGLAYMAGNLINAAQNSTILIQAVQVGTRGAVRPQFMLAAANQWRLGPMRMAEQAFKMSDALRHRMDHELAVLYNDVQKSFSQRGFWSNAREWAQLHAFFLQRFVDKHVLPLVFIAAYNQHIADNTRVDAPDDVHARAVEFAESVIRQYASSNLPEDVSRIETGSPIWRSVVQFTSWANGVFNTEVQSGIRVAKEMGVRRAAPKLIGYHFLYGLMLPVIVGEVIASAFKGEIGDDEDKDGWWIDDFFRKTFLMGAVKGALAPVPLGSAAARAVAGNFTANPYDDPVRTIPWVSAMESALALPGDFYENIWEGKGKVSDTVRHAGTAATLLTGVPFTVLARPAGYLTGIAEGRIRPDDPLDFTRGLVTGVASPESKVQR